MAVIKFGTDGWRAIIGAEYTYANVRRCAVAVAQDLIATYEDARKRCVVVGYDTRFSSDRFAQTAAEMVAANGIDVWLFDRAAPTPACAFAVFHLGALAGIMITASHNPSHWNGFKVKADYGGTAPIEQIERIEHLLANPAAKPTGNAGQIKSFNPLPDYVEQLKRSVNLSTIQSAGLHVIVDEMHGAGAGILKTVLEGGDVLELRHEPNPSFPNMKQPEPIDENLTPLKQAVRESSNAIVGLAFDGDADRLGVVDETGQFMSAGDVFALLFYQMLERRAERGSVACTITMSSMIDKIAKRYDVPVYRTPVGFKYIAPIMLSENCIIGGEESGGYAFSKHIPDRDGVASALIFLEAIAQSGKTPTQMLQELHNLVGKHAYYREDLTIADDQKQRIAQILSDYNPTELNRMQVKTIDHSGGLKINLTDDGWWVACRLSGTEPLIRIYAEAPNDQTAQDLVNSFKATLEIG